MHVSSKFSSVLHLLGNNPNYYLERICKDQSKKFCPSCGGPTLTRVSVTLKAPDSGAPNQEPELVVHLKKNYQWKLRGTNTDLPPPKIGHAKGGGEPPIILREDQKEWERGVRSEALRKRKEEKRVQKALSEKEKRGDDAVWMDDDWVPSLLAGGGSRSGRGMPRIGYKAPKPNRRK